MQLFTACTQLQHMCFQNDLLLANYIIAYIITEFTAVATFTYTSTTVPIIDAHLPVATCTYKCISATNTIQVHVDQPLSCTYCIQWLVYSNYLCQEQTWICHMTNSWGIVPAYRKKSVVIFKLSGSIYSSSIDKTYIDKTDRQRQAVIVNKSKLKAIW